MNELVLDDDLKENSWRLFKTQKNGYKLYSIGYTYTVDKPVLSLVPQASKVYWKCEDRTCPGRSISCGLNPPLKLTQSHFGHEKNINRLNELETIKKLK
ncbi:unnamed protein product, partial [Brachionus calyciflorus]